jgi:hypothetical protein
MSKTPSINIRSTDWQELRGWLVDRMEEEKLRIMNTELTEVDTAKVRGVYLAFKEILALESRIEKQVLQRNPQA